MGYATSSTRKWYDSLAGTGAVIACMVLFAAFCWVTLGLVEMHTAEALNTNTASPPLSDAGAGPTSQKQATPVSTEFRIDEMENTLQSIKTTGERAEARSYENKMMARELIRHVKVMVVVLILIAVVFPLTIWMMSRRRLEGLSGLSSEIAATLVVVEERQAKLANILREIQGEIDFLHTMSVPDLKNLIQQAESYLEQNEKDLGRAGLRRDRPL